MKGLIRKISALILCVGITISSIGTLVYADNSTTSANKTATSTVKKTLTYSNFTLADVSSYSGKAYTSINKNKPFFTKSELKKKSYEKYSDLDDSDRCGYAIACIGTDIMPTEERGAIGSVKPTGWHTVKYNDYIEGNYLYNRCHLIGYQLTGENANEKNLITGTRYMNTEGMLPFENMVADYVKETENHVMYRITPMFSGSDLLAKGVLMEAYSVEDNGKGICFNVFCYNVQPNIIIDYSDGSSKLSPNAKKLQDNTSEKKTTSTTTSKKTTSEKPKETTTTVTTSTKSQSKTYILNTNTNKFHDPSCSSVKQMKDKNKQTYKGSREDVISQGYSPCKKCSP